MATQLLLLEAGEADWKLDEDTKAIGRRGIAEARRALAEAIGRSARSERRAPAA